MSTFAQLGVPAPLVDALSKRGINEPFPVQAAAIPDALEGRDISGKAPTGSGKTLAFGIPLLARVEKAKSNHPRALILAPTRELAEQIKQDLNPLANAAHRSVTAVYGGVGYGPQKNALRKGADILVATPGRLEDLMEQRSVDLSHVDIVVIDEADRMADMGFMPAVRRILDRTAKQRQTLLFSATLDGDIAILSRDYQNNPVGHEAGAIEPDTIDARHHFWLVQHHDRVQHAADLIDEKGRSIVFTRTRHGADRLARQLGKLGYSAVALHGGRSQNQRTRALKAFSSGRVQALIATDVAARGIHIDAVETVIHFDPPGDHKDYLHRSGRTARAGASGTVVSLVTHEQRRAIGQMQRALNLDAPIGSPSLEALGHGGYQIGEVPAREQAHQSKPARRTGSERRSETPRNRRDAGSSEQSVYVGNLAWGSTANDIEKLFAAFGSVRQATIVTDRRNGRSKGFGFVNMGGHQEARSAIDGLHGTTLHGRDLKVRLARPQAGRN
ncbi:MAG: DEAD/DEAH box helicase [Acidimicrobiia bacterium]|nr:DEAD/DEAH box helicase [Acidimicrobiia bacterium]